MSPTIHASVVLAGARGVLIRGETGAGKSRLVLSLLHAANAGLLPFARLVADDRVHIEAHHGRSGRAHARSRLPGLSRSAVSAWLRCPVSGPQSVKLVVDLQTRTRRAHAGACRMQG